jgi:hypothetical protein
MAKLFFYVLHTSRFAWCVCFFFFSSIRQKQRFQEIPSTGSKVSAPSAEVGSDGKRAKERGKNRGKSVLFMFYFAWRKIIYFKATKKFSEEGNYVKNVSYVSERQKPSKPRQQQ